MKFPGLPTNDGSPEHEKQVKLYWRIGAIALLILYAIGFVLENHKPVSVHFVLFTARVSLIWVIVLGVGLGVAGGVLLSQLYRRRRGPKEGS